MTKLLSLVLFSLYQGVSLLILANIVISWVPQWRWTPIGRFVYRLTDPPLALIRRFVRPLAFGGRVGIDLSPMILLMAAFVVYNVLAKLID